MTSGMPAGLLAIRGGLLGLVLGDAVGAAGRAPADEVLPATAAGQLVCFTVDGIIRASVRLNNKGFCDPPGVVWHAYARWAAGQGIPGVVKGQLDGWLADVAALRVRRGSAPATVAALQGRTMGTLDRPVGTSTGAHALTRSLPAGLASWWTGDAAGFVRRIAVTTHAVAAADTAAVGAALLARLAQGHGMEDAAGLARQDCAAQVPPQAVTPLADGLAAAAAHPRDAERLCALAPDPRADAVLAGAVYVAASFREPAELVDALVFASGANRHVAATVGALLGAAAGADRLPVDLVPRLELGEVMDQLARDMVREFTDSPSRFLRGADAAWSRRYPGW